MLVFKIFNVKNILLTTQGKGKHKAKAAVHIGEPLTIEERKATIEPETHAVFL